MDHEQYVVARRTRLVELAVELGASPDDAPDLVDRVLDEQRRAIARSEDPDPLVREAVSVAVLGGPPPGRPRPVALVAVLVLAAIVAAVAVVVVRQVDVAPEPTPRVPTTFALEADQAVATLEDAGYRAELRDVVRCETPDQVLGTDPAAGQEAPGDSTVTVLVARPPGLSCPDGVGFRTMVWQVLRWVGGVGPAPRLGDGAGLVIIDDTGTTTARLTDDGLEQLASAGGALEPLREAVTEPAPTPDGFPELIVRNAVVEPPCGATPPDGYDDLLSVRFDLDTSPAGDDACPLTGYLVPDGAGGRLQTLVLLVPGS